MAARWEPYEPRGSRTVLGERGGGIPPRYSPALSRVFSLPPRDPSRDLPAQVPALHGSAALRRLNRPDRSSARSPRLGCDFPDDYV